MIKVTITPAEENPKFRFQGPRYRVYGKSSGQEFSEDYLIPFIEKEILPLKEECALVIDFKETERFNPVFLDEICVELITSGLAEILKNTEVINVKMPWCAFFRARKKILLEKI